MFDAKIMKDNCVDWIKKFFEQNGNDCNAIVGISGGKDSSVVAALCVEALGKDRVIGVLMPCGEQSDINYSKQLVEFLGIRNYTINIKSVVDEMISLLPDDMKVSRQTKINLPARIRMVTLYAISQSNNGRVANTCNLSEDYVGYATRYGDGAGDFSPLSRLTVQEVKAIGNELGLPDNLIRKIPIDGLCGKTDEENLGFTYEILDKYIRNGICENVDVKARIDVMHRNNCFKLKPMPYFEPNI